MTRRVTSRALAILALLALAATAKAVPPRPTPLQIKTGYDIAVAKIDRNGTAPEFTFINLGEKPINRTLRFSYSCNGNPVAASSIQFSLAPGQRKVWKGGPTDVGFAKDGDRVEVTIDSNNELREDNEANNTKSRLFVKIMRR